MKIVQTEYMHSLYAKGNDSFIDMQAIQNNTRGGVPFDLIYRVDLPYPNVEVSGTHKEYLGLVSEDYAGVISEMTSLSQYDYQKLVLDNPTYKEISEALDAISSVERLHLDLMGELVILLGGDSRYWSIRKGTPQYWSPQYVNYTKSPRDILLENIKGEELAIKQYQSHIVKIRDPQVVALLRRIVLDEQLHLEIFKDLYTRYFG
ncbi:MAG: ferritin-like domain-containing protein [Cellulosilyticaceae bacterium]